MMCKKTLVIVLLLVLWFVSQTGGQLLFVSVVRAQGGWDGMDFQMRDEYRNPNGGWGFGYVSPRWEWTGGSYYQSTPYAPFAPYTQGGYGTLPWNPMIGDQGNSGTSYISPRWGWAGWN